MQTVLDKAILASRHILVVFYVGLAAALALYAVRFAWKVWKFGAGLLEAGDTDLLLDLLHLLDAALVAALVVTVAVSSYDSLVSRLTDSAAGRAAHFAAEAADAGNLKIRLATAIVAISSIHLLQILLKVQDFQDREILWGLAIYALFLAGGLALAAMDRLEGKTKAPRDGDAEERDGRGT